MDLSNLPPLRRVEPGARYSLRRPENTSSHDNIIGDDHTYNGGVIRRRKTTGKNVDTNRCASLRTYSVCAGAATAEETASKRETGDPLEYSVASLIVIN